MESSLWKRMLTLLRRRRFVLLLTFVALLIAIPLLYRASRLAGLPDIGAPFDVNKFGTIEITVDKNAFIEYNHAMPTDDPQDVEEAIEKGWPATPPAVRNWLEENGEALELLRKGSHKPKALNAQPKDQSFLTMIGAGKHRALSRLARLEAARLFDAGDVEAAWEWYRVAFRHSRHIGMYGQKISRIMGVAFHFFVSEKMIEWSADPRVNASLLRRAIENVVSDYKLTQPPSTTLRIEYFERLNWFELFDRHMQEFREFFVEVPPPLMRYLKNEPEVGKRIVKLVYANWLSQADLPKHQQSPRYPGDLGLFESNAGAKLPGGVAPSAIEEFYSKSHIAQFAVGGGPPFGSTIIREETRQSQLVVTLTAQLFFREHGRFPKSSTELLDKYLSDWPDDPYRSDEAPMGFRYDATKGAVTIWSVGPNGIDDGGNVDVGWNDPQFDLGMRIYAPSEQSRQ